jgi:thiamine-phosphate pyrophosphorylase
MINQTLRIIDANLDRASEGLRVMEDIARFILESAPTARSLKNLRHSIHQAFPDIAISLISARNSTGDVGRATETYKEPAGSLIDTVLANASRVEQSLRVLEEVARLPGADADGAFFEEARYAMYDLEKELVSRLSRRDKNVKLGSYHVVANETQLFGAIERKVTTIQLDPGTMTQREFYRLAEAARECSRANNILLIIGGHLGITISTNADGIAFNENSLPITVARGLLKVDQVIGYAAKSVEEALQAESCGADYILCAESLRENISSEVKIPVVSPVREDIDGRNL